LSEIDPLAVAGRVAAALEGLGVRYLLGGSLASTALGEPRATLDVDLVADLGQSTVGPWLAALGPDFVGDADWVHEEVARHGSFQLLHLPSLIRVDVFVPPWEGVHLWKWQTRRRLLIDPSTGQGIDVTGAEGIVVQKLVWFRSGGEVSDRQWRDVMGVLKAQRARLDLLDLRKWAAEAGVLDLLDRALQAAGYQG
jgi:hypothetical protein